MSCTPFKDADTKYKVFSALHVLIVWRATTLLLTLIYFTDYVKQLLKIQTILFQQ